MAIFEKSIRFHQIIVGAQSCSTAVLQEYTAGLSLKLLVVLLCAVTLFELQFQLDSCLQYSMRLV